MKKQTEFFPQQLTQVIDPIWAITDYYPCFRKRCETMLGKIFGFSWCTSVGVSSILKLNIKNHKITKHSEIT